MSSKNHAHADAAHAHHGPSVSIYWVIFGCLTVLTVLTVAVSRVYLPPVGAVVVAFMIAISKATLVVTFFMHVKYDSKVLRILCVVPTLLTMVLLLALLPDIASHGRQIAGDPALHVVAEADHADHGHDATEEHATEEH
jgi:cytochrome c oxidase subunit IV